MTREPEFDQFDREHFAALAEVHADTCSGCGGLLSETTVKDHGYDIEHHTCWKCHGIAGEQAVLANSAEAEADREKNPRKRTIRPSAEHWTAVRIPLPD
ncbi:hypothetical protein [Kribbella deserti]|uniref:Uncharacterized protein n=1 Tax=Kribbella deserti TaxID=1926257 RepID=A0ABV6QGB1_9ACTN